MDAPPETALRADLPGLGPRSELFVDTEDLTADRTTRANEMPEVEPKNLESEAPWTETMPMLDTSLSILSFSS